MIKAELEAKCILESPPGSTAACPVHVDARALAAAIQQADYAAGDSIAINVLERICIGV